MRSTTIFLIILFAFASCGLNTVKSKPENIHMSQVDTQSSFYDFKIKSLDGSEEIDFARYQGKKVLIVNVASECGFTPQYEQLQGLHEQYGDQVVVLGFPCNQFGGQEPGSATEIAQFCKKNYGVSFQMFEKVKVKKGEDQHPLYQWLTNQEANGWNEQAPTWNFCKYLINEQGELVKFYGSAVDPVGDEILSAIEG